MKRYSTLLIIREIQNYNEISPYTSQNDNNRKKITSVVDDVAKPKPIFLVDENIVFYSCFGKLFASFSKC